MSFRKLTFALALTAGALALPAATPSFAAAGSASFTIHAMVQTICKVQYDNPVAPIAGQTTDLGQFTQLCNDGDGYQVMLVTPAGTSGAAIIDGNTIPLATNGQTLIVDSNSDAYKTQDLKLQLAADAAPFTSVQFITTPKGAVY